MFYKDKTHLTNIKYTSSRRNDKHLQFLNVLEDKKTLYNNITDYHFVLIVQLNTSSNLKVI